MTQSKISPPENIPQDNRARDVYRYSLITAGVMAAATVAIRYLFGVPPNYYDANYWAGVISLVALLCAWMSKRGQIDQGLALLIASIQAAIIIPSIKNDGLAIAFSAVGVISTFSFSSLIKSRRLAVFTNFASLAVAALLLSLDFFRPFERIPNTDVVSTWIVAGGVILVYLAIIARQAWSGNIRVKLVTSFTAVALLAVVIVGYTSYLNLQKQIRADIGQRLINMTSIVASQQDGDLHAAIQTPEDMAGDAYKIMTAQASKIAATDPNIAYIYTMRMDEQGQIYFIIDAGQGDYESGLVGAVYKEPSDLLLENFKTLDHTIVEKDFYTDEFGTVLSAYAPIYRADGTREAIVAVDFFADKILGEKARPWHRKERPKPKSL